jgi:hypothetical protein
MKNRREFLKSGASLMATLPAGDLLKGATGEAKRPVGDAPQSGGIGSEQIAGPMIEEIAGRMGPVTQLADGRFLATYPEGRMVKDWDDVATPQKMFGRFSPDGLGNWSDPQILFSFPEGPGASGHGITAGGALPITTRDGAVHLFGVRISGWPKEPHPKVSEMFKAQCALWHTTSPDNGKSWGPLQNIEYGHSYTGALNSVIQLNSGRILLVLSYHSSSRSTGFFVSEAVYSDDGGKTWRTAKNDVPVESGGKAGESGACEPVVVELNDGRVWMIIRTQTGYLFESFSGDGGETWSVARRTIFRASNAPAGVLRLRDGRLVMVWNNEFGPPFRDGISYSRQSLVMAIQDGKNWRGYRELVTFGEGDNLNGYGGARYPFLVEARDGSILVPYAEDGRASRKKEQFRAFMDYRVVRVDPRWLTERDAREDFTKGLDRLQLAATGGAEVLPGPEGKPALRLTKPREDKPCGLCWNFPFGRKGRLQIRLRTEPGFGGIYFALAETFLAPSHNGGGNFRWMVAPNGKVMAQHVSDLSYDDTGAVSFGIEEGRKFQLEAGETHEFVVKWNCEDNVADIELDGRYTTTLVGLEMTRGICYLHVYSAAPTTDSKGLWLLSFDSQSLS